MDATAKKLPPEAAKNLRTRAIDSVRPFALMLAPVYVFMKLNEKFVQVKSSLDFFTPEELARLKPFGNLFVYESIDRVTAFAEAGKKVREILQQASVAAPAAAIAPDTRDPYPETALPPAPFEVSNAVIRILSKLWDILLPDASAGVDLFGLTAFADEVCDVIPGATLRQARDADVSLYERAIFSSSWAVFLALHLGYCELGFLNALRMRVFGETAGLSPASAERRDEVDELVALVAEVEGDRQTGRIHESHFLTRAERASQKLASRLNRVKRLRGAANV